MNPCRNDGIFFWDTLYTLDLAEKSDIFTVLVFDTLEKEARAGEADID